MTYSFHYWLFQVGPQQGSLAWCHLNQKNDIEFSSEAKESFILDQRMKRGLELGNAGMHHLG